ncbi:MAG: glycosyltransferase [Magnetospirillum sp.]|nr:glycosyltransferase [Magnetospirillum sp.]
MGFPVYNGGTDFVLAMESLLAQTYADFEIIISDNASTDGTLERCREFERRDPRVRVIAQPENRGGRANFQTVVKLARGRYFMWAAHDDIWMPRFIEVLLKELEDHPDACVAMCATELREASGNIIDVLRFPFVNTENGATTNSMFLGLASGLKINLYIYGLFKASIVRKAIDHFPDALGGDRQFMVQFALAAPFRYVDEILYRRLVNREHELEQRKASLRPRIFWRQIRAFPHMFLSSPVIGTRQKLLLPYYEFCLVTHIVRRALINAKHLAECGKLPLFKKLIASGRNMLKFGTLTTLSVSCLATLFFLFSGRTELALLSLLFAMLAIQVWQSLRIRGINQAMVQQGKAMDRQSSRLTKISTAFEYMSPGSSAGGGEPGQGVSAGVSRDIRLLNSEMRRVTDLALIRNIETLEGAKFDSAVLSPYAQNRLVQLERHIAFGREFEASRIRNLYAGEIFPELAKICVPVGAINEQTGHPNKADMIYVCAVARLIGAKRLFEFGTYLGRTTYHLAQTCEDAEIHTLNIPLEQAGKYAKYIGKLFKGSDRESQIHQIFENSMTFDPSPMKNTFDFVFIDADHGYDAVINDTRKAFELLRPGGIVMWHDYSPKSPGLVKAIREFTQNERPLFRIRNTCLLLHIDGVDPLTFEPHQLPDTLEADHAARDPYRIEEIYP